MPKPRKPTSQIAAETLARNRGRYAGRELNEPKPTNSLGNVPSHLTENQKKLWKKLVATIPDGVLFAIDAVIVELTVRLTEKMHLGALKASEIGQLRGCLASLGATPADRSRVSVVPPETNPANDPTSFLDE